MRFSQILALCSIIILQACGGGSSSGGDTSNQTTPTVNQAPTISVTAQVNITEGTTSVDQISGSDPEGKAISYAIVGGADQAGVHRRDHPTVGEASQRTAQAIALRQRDHPRGRRVLRLASARTV